jgi:hypothetical protein
VVRFFEGLDETFEDLQLIPQEVVDAGDRVATRLRHRGRGKASGVEIDAELCRATSGLSGPRSATTLELILTGWQQVCSQAGVRSTLKQVWRIRLWRSSRDRSRRASTRSIPAWSPRRSSPRSR